MPAQPAAPPAPPALPALPSAGQIAAGIPVPGGRITVAGVSGSPADVLRALKARRDELNEQRSQLQDRRGELSEQLKAERLDETDRKGLQTQLTDVDARIANVDKQIQATSDAVAEATGYPGAVVEDPPPPPRTGPPDEVFVIPIVFTIFVLFPLAIAWARRLWKKPMVAPAVIPPEFTERMSRLEQAVEAVAVEVERIGEGQRFVTKLFAEGPKPLELPK